MKNYIEHPNVLFDVDRKMSIPKDLKNTEYREALASQKTGKAIFSSPKISKDEALAIGKFRAKRFINEVIGDDLELLQLMHAYISDPANPDLQEVDTFIKEVTKEVLKNPTLPDFSHIERPKGYNHLIKEILK